MSFKISPGSLPSIIHIPTSKSYANRALILAAIKHSPVTIKGMPNATDVVFLKEALIKVGLKIQEDQDQMTVSNWFPDCEAKAEIEINVGEGGTTARFLASMLVMGKSTYTLILGERLKERPWIEFTELVQRLGGHAELQDNKLILKGPIHLPGNLEVDCSKTTQFASGFQLATAFANTIVIPKNLTSSASYWDMTNKMIEHIQQHCDFHVPLDWSSASYPLAFGALKHEISFPGLHPDSFQADSKFFNLLSDMGLARETKEGIKVKPQTGLKKDINLDVSDCLDLVPTLGFFLAHIDGTHVLQGIENLVHKESDRLKEVISLLEEFGFKSYEKDQNLVIEGSSLLRSMPINLKLPDDHRMVMTGALFLRFHQGGSVEPERAVEKSYPSFWTLLK